VAIPANVYVGAVPLLLVEDENGEGRPIMELLELCTYLLHRNRNFDSARALCGVVGRLADLYLTVYGHQAVSADDLLSLSYLYGHCRREGGFGLPWEGVGWASLRTDLIHLRTYAQFCTDVYGHLAACRTGIFGRALECSCAAGRY
jgi:hypothetical protein